MIEIKNSITKSFFHLIRFGGLLIIPFIYGFSYIYAFYDPFQKMDQVQVSIITPNNELGNALGKQLAKDNEVIMGDIHMTIQMKHMYDVDNGKQLDVDQVKKDSYATLQIKNTATLERIVIDAIAAELTTGIGGIAFKLKLLADIATALSTNNSPDIVFNINYKKSYLLAFGIDAGASLFSTVQFIEHQIIEAIQTPEYITHIATDSALAGHTSQEVSTLLSTIGKVGMSSIEPIKVHAHMGEHAKYGYGLAPFFISVAMWVGGMVMTFAVHRKIYDHAVGPTMRYFAKFSIITFGVVIQATILMVALYLIGFNELGMGNWLSMYFGAIVSGLIFASIIQAIRFSIHNRTIGILLTIIMLVLQMASGGGLFPIETQSSFYQVVNKIVPMGRTVTIFRELAYDTNWANVFIQLAWLSPWLLIIPTALTVNRYRTMLIHQKMGWPMPHSRFYKGGSNV